MRSFALVLSFLAGSARADLMPVFDLETAQTLPQGVYSPRFKMVRSRSMDKYDAVGDIKPLAAGFNRTLSWTDVLAAQANDVDREQLRSLLVTGQPIAESAAAGVIQAQVSSATSAAVPVMLFGLTERFTLGVAIPVINVDVNVDSGFEKSASAQEVIDRACTASSPVKCSEAAARLNDAVQYRLKSLGYQPLSSQRFTAIGDIRVLGRYSVVRETGRELTIKPTLYLPTGKQSSADDALSLRTGEGRWALAVTAVFDEWEPLGARHFKLTAYAGAGAQAPDTKLMRVPTASSVLSADKEDIRRGLSTSVSAGLSLGYSIRPVGVNVGAGYHFQYATAADHKGDSLGAERYKLLSDQYPSQRLHSATLLVGFSTVEWYRSKEFSVPFEVNFTYNRAIGGRHSFSGDLYAMEALFYL